MNPKQQHAEERQENIGLVSEELMLGTWLSIALLGAALVRSRNVNLCDLVASLEEAENLTRSIDKRHLAIGAVRQLIEEFSRAHNTAVPAAGCSGRRALAQRPPTKTATINRWPLTKTQSCPTQKPREY